MRDDDISRLARAARDAPAADKAPLHLALGSALEAQGQLERAARAFSVAVKLLPHDHDAYYSLGVVLGKAKRAGLARAAFAVAVSLMPSEPRTQRAHALTTTMLGRSNEAAALLRATLRLAPRYVDAQFELGVALMESSQYMAAIQEYGHLLTWRDVPPQMVANTLANRGTCLKDVGRPQEAVDAYTRALQIAPRFAAVYNNLAVLAAGDLRQPELALRMVAVGRPLAPAELQWDSARVCATTRVQLELL